MNFLRAMDRKRAARSAVTMFVGIGIAAMVGALVALPWWLCLIGFSLLTAGWLTMYTLLERWTA